MSQTLNFVVANLYLWVAICAGSLGFLVVNSKAFEPWRRGVTQILKDPMTFDPMKEINEAKRELDKRPKDFIDGWSVVAVLCFVGSFLLVVTSLLVRASGS